MVKNILDKIFSIDTKSSGFIVINILGLRIRHRKSNVKKYSEQFLKLDCPITEIPPAKGTLRKIQLANLKMIQIFDKLCKENNLSYFLDFGNLLGAVRHKGFIPWDDDVDLGMMRDDYERFINLFKDGIPGYDDIYISFNNNGKDKCFLKVLHKKLPNIAVDVFPYDFYYKKTDSQEKLELTKKIRKIISRKLYKFLYPFFIKRPDKMRLRFAKIRDNEILNKHIVDKSIEPSIFFGIDYPHRYENYFFDYNKILPLGSIKFEGLSFPCPNDTDFVLRQNFGDYMTLPDECYPRHNNFEFFENEKELNEFIGENNG